MVWIVQSFWDALVRFLRMIIGKTLSNCSMKIMRRVKVLVQKDIQWHELRRVASWFSLIESPGIAFTLGSVQIIVHSYKGFMKYLTGAGATFMPSNHCRYVFVSKLISRASTEILSWTRVIKNNVRIIIISNQVYSDINTKLKAPLWLFPWVIINAIIGSPMRALNPISVNLLSLFEAFFGQLCPSQ